MWATQNNNFLSLKPVKFRSNFLINSIGAKWFHYALFQLGLPGSQLLSHVPISVAILENCRGSSWGCLHMGTGGEIDGTSANYLHPWSEFSLLICYYLIHSFSSTCFKRQLKSANLFNHFLNKDLRNTLLTGLSPFYPWSAVSSTNSLVPSRLSCFNYFSILVLNSFQNAL